MMTELDQLWAEGMAAEIDKYKNLVFDIIAYLKKEKDHEGTSAVASPSDILDKVFGMAGDLQDVKDKILT